jgi:RNA polymerase sigma factor (sigma-70 family)
MVIKTPQKDDDTYYKAVIHENLQFIERQCFKAVQLHYEKASLSKLPHLTLENESLELFNHILDKLREKNYRILKNFKGKSKLSTYLTVIIANQIVDTIRKKRGRTREKERARPFGLLGSQIIQRILVEGCPPDRLFQELKSQNNFSHTREEFESIVEKIKGSRLKGINALPENQNPFLKKGQQNPQSGELIIMDPKKNPEESAIQNQTHKKINDMLELAIGELSGEERLILRMRFSIHGEEEPKDFNTIARHLSISKKAAYKKISRILKKCRQILIQRGFDINDLL